MLRISKLADYAVLIMVCLMKADQPLSAAQVAESLNLALPTTRKILKLLLQAELLASSRGAQGGYSLPHSANDLTLCNVVEAVDGPIAITDCNCPTSGCVRAARCDVKGYWQNINDVVINSLQQVKLTDMAFGHAINLLQA